MANFRFLSSPENLLILVLDGLNMSSSYSIETKQRRATQPEATVAISACLDKVHANQLYVNSTLKVQGLSEAMIEVLNRCENTLTLAEGLLNTSLQAVLHLNVGNSPNEFDIIAKLQTSTSLQLWMNGASDSQDVCQANYSDGLDAVVSKVLNRNSLDLKAFIKRALGVATSYVGTNTIPFNNLGQDN